MKPEAGHLILILIGGGAAYFFGAAFAKTVRIIRLVRTTKTSRIRDLRPGSGIVEVEGRVVRSEEKLLNAPLSTVACVYYAMTIEERRKRHRSRRHGNRNTQHHWVSVASARELTTVLVNDGTGTVEIDFRASPELILEEDEKFRSGFLNDPPPYVKRMLQDKYGTDTERFGFNKSMRYRETYIAPGDKLYAIGQFRGSPPKITSGAEVFVVADGDERAFLSRYRTRAFGYAVGTLISGFFAALPVIAFIQSRG